ncbi:MAG: hypothetical protein M0Z46_03885 [Actinomycetota bacterium]|jgi:hypothetical protein|nr:hypothetical protein [Actinomycetota bacterium]MDA8314034.1 hypothetical protein [Actinomycetota bacterium]
MPLIINAPRADDASRAAGLEHNASSAAPAEALFPEARQRARRRRVGAGLVLAMLATFATLLGAGAFGGSASPPPPTAASGFSRLVLASTEAAGTAAVSFRYRDRIMGGCIPDTNSPINAGHGVLDFADDNAAFVETTTGCKDITPQTSTRWRSIHGVAYVTFPKNIPGGPTSASRPWAALPATGPASVAADGELGGLIPLNEPLRLLAALQGHVRRIGRRELHGVATVAYAGHATLASVEATNGFGRDLAPAPASKGARLEPAAATIPIQIEVWLDAADRVRQVVATELLYTGIYKGGSDMEDAAQVPTIETIGEGHSLAPPTAGTTGVRIPHMRILHLPLVRLRQQSDLQLQLSIAGFGRPAHLVAPPSGRVVRPSER